MLCSSSTPGNCRTIFLVDLCFQGSRPVSYLIQRETKTERRAEQEREIARFTIVSFRLYSTDSPTMANSQKNGQETAAVRTERLDVSVVLIWCWNPLVLADS